VRGYYPLSFAVDMNYPRVLYMLKLWDDVTGASYLDLPDSYEIICDDGEPEDFFVFAIRELARSKSYACRIPATVIGGSFHVGDR